MVQRLDPIKTQMVTKDGECHLTITLELNINVNGEVGTVQATAVKQDKPVETVVEKRPEFIVPDFTSGPRLNNF